MDNIALPLKLRGVSRTSAARRAPASSELVGIDGFEKRWPSELRAACGSARQSPAP